MMMCYDTSKDDLAAIKLIVDGADDPYQSVVERGLNRTDDPLVRMRIGFPKR